jgi:hypothetical protein
VAGEPVSPLYSPAMRFTRNWFGMVWYTARVCPAYSGMTGVDGVRAMFEHRQT